MNPPHQTHRDYRQPPERKSMHARIVRTLGMRIVAGRSFADTDTNGAPGVSIINQTLAARLFGDENPVGRDLVVRSRSTTWLKEARTTVVGVVENSKDVGIHAVDMSSVYVPLVRRSSPESGAPWPRPTRRCPR